MNTTDLYNLKLVNSPDEVDQINKKFYGRFNYPWPPASFQGYAPGMANLFLNQDIGFWGHDRVPAQSKILVAGCGTNQALFTALKFPAAEVLGVDISTQSLATCRRNADQMGVKNLKLEERSLNALEYEEEFDYVICTGVVHHNADPQLTLRKISATLKKDGIMEFMVYNYYHRLLTVACQKAIRSFNTSDSLMELEEELELVKPLMKDFPYQNYMGAYLKQYLKLPEADMADMLLQPVEYSYTIESLYALLSNCNLEYSAYCTNQFDIGNDYYSWNINLGNPFLQNRYDALPDMRRWQISNLLLCNNSPNLWFYLQRKDSNYSIKSEEVICKEFLETRFRKSSFPVKNYIINPNGDYILSTRLLKYPLGEQHADPLARKILALLDPALKMKDILSKAGVKLTIREINDLRTKLTTVSFPYLLAIEHPKTQAV